MRRALLFAGLLVLPSATFAQQSASFRLDEHVLNAAGHPQAGAVLGSAGYVISLDALGDSTMGVVTTSASYSLEGGYLAAYPPPGEVLNLAFADSDTLVWEASGSAGLYNLYRGDTASLAGGDAGNCQQPGIAAALTIDSAEPGPGSGWFYIVTVENRLGVEGTRGADSAGVPRPESDVCP